MTDLLFRVLLPMSLAGSLCTLLFLALRPLARRLPARHRRAALCAALALFLAPLSLSMTGGGAESPAPAAQAAREGLRTAAPTAPLYRAGEALARELDATEPQDNVQNATPPAGSNPQEKTQTPTSGLAWLLSTFKGAGLPRLAAWTYLAGLAVLGIAGLARYALLMVRLKRDAEPVTDEALLSTYRALCAELGVRRPPLLQTGRVSAPLLAGVLHPRILLPAGTAGPEAEYALRHELCHHRRGDLPLKLLALLVCWAHWFNPAAHLLRRLLADVCEESCDEAVAASLDKTARRAYAETLLAYAGPAPSGMVSALSTPARRLRRRLAALVKPARPTRGTRVAGVAALLMMLCVCALAGCSLAAGATSPATPTDAPESGSLSVSAPGGDASEASGKNAVRLDAEDLFGTRYAIAVPHGQEALYRRGVTEAPMAQTDMEDWTGTPSAAGFIPPVAGVSPKLMEDYIDTGAKSGDLPVYEATHTYYEFLSPGAAPVYAVADGTVVVADHCELLGYYMVVSHEGGIASLYANCHAFAVESGGAVRQGQPIATNGDPASSAWQALHFGLYKGLVSTVESLPLLDFADARLLNLADYIDADDAAADEPAQPAAAMICPVPDAQYSSRGFGGMHRGLDLNAEQGTPIYAAAAGTVTTSGYHDANGYHIIIDHGDGLETVYSHCNVLNVSEGQSVQQGEHIAGTGNTGMSTGSHCHFEVLVDGEVTDPLDWIELPDSIQLP